MNPGGQYNTAVAVIRVAIGVIVRNHHVLVARRPPGVHLAGYWEFPGGKVRVGESPQQALRRELYEELGLRVRLGAGCPVQRHRYADRVVELLPYYCHPVAGRPRPLAALTLRWVVLKRLGVLRFPAANRRLLAYLVAREALRKMSVK